MFVNVLFEEGGRDPAFLYKEGIMSSPKLNTLILNGLSVTGNFNDALNYIEEGLTSQEYDDVKNFFAWLDKEGKTIGHGNIDAQWADFLASGMKSKGRTADEEYKAAAFRVQKLINQIGLKLRMHQEMQKYDKFNWGHVGDLTALEKPLSEIAGMVENYGTEQKGKKEDLE